MVASYYSLTKPGIIRGNLFSAAGGFFLASRGNVDVFLFLAMMLGTIFIVASGCVFNNYIDRGIDAKMSRTQKRAIVIGKIPSKNALIFGTVLGLVSLLVFLIFTNALTAISALVGFIFYVFIYGYFKRKNIYGTIIGSVSGAVPPVIGYTAVSQSFDLGALLLFLILVAWQMPHFYAIGIYRISEYKEAALPILSIVKGIHMTKIHMVLFAAAFIFFSSLLTIFEYTGFIYLAVMLIIGLVWFYKIANGFTARDDNEWAKKVFSFSLIVLVVFCCAISIDFIFPF